LKFQDRKSRLPRGSRLFYCLFSALAGSLLVFGSQHLVVGWSRGEGVT